MNIIINPAAYENKYISYLNECFPGWGNTINYDWTFKKDFGLRNADFFLIENEGEVIAGSALTYRTVAMPNGQTFVHGTMTGSWTLPAARGKGCFSVIIQESEKLVASHQYNFLTAYVTESNASFRRLEAAGSYLVPTNYIACTIPETDEAFEITEVVSPSVAVYEKLYHLRNEQVKYSLHYSYTLEEFIAQFIDRAEGKSRIVTLGDDYCILSETATTFRILYSSSYQFAFLQQLRMWAKSQQKNLFFFTTKIIEKTITHPEYKIIPGYFTILSNDEAVQQEMVKILKQNHFHIEYGDKM